jgi:hypothetical protein
MLDPHLATSGNVTKKAVTFLIIQAKKAVTLCPKGHVNVVSQVILEPILHKLYGSEVCHE